MKHTGLVVYHPERCSFFGSGLYVWDGQEWIKIGVKETMGVRLSTNLLHLPSGHDLRALAPSYGVQVDWAPSGFAPPTWGIESGGTVDMTFSPAGIVDPSPQTMTLVGNAISQSDISSNLFFSRESKIVFNFLGCDGATTQLLVNQTNKALTIDGSVEVPFIETSVPIYDKTHDLESNAIWNLSVIPDAGHAFSNIRVGGNALTTEARYGEEFYNGQHTGAQLRYDVIPGGAARYSTIILADAQMPKRFADISISVIQCDAGSTPSLSELAQMAGFSGVKEKEDRNPNSSIAQQDDVQAQIDTPHPISTVAWHRDQDENIFLSSDFGPAGRWMITNLAAENFVQHDPANGLVRTGDDQAIISQMKTGADGNAASSLSLTSFAYAKSYLPVATIVPGEAMSDEVKNNPRLGRLYTWAAATNSKGGVNGTLIKQDGENAPSPQTERRQGICPNGWHLPSDAEWTALEREIDEHMTEYSSEDATDANQGVATGGAGSQWRGKYHGRAMRDACQLSTNVSDSRRGSSNILSSYKHAGFDASYSGYAKAGKVDGMSNFIYYWTASGTNQNNTAWSRGIASSYASMQ